MRHIDKEKRKKYQKQWRKNNKNHIKLYLLKNKLKRSAQNKKWRECNKEYLKNYNIKNKERHKKSNIKWIKQNKEAFNEYHRKYKVNKEKINTEFKLINRVRTRIYLACKSKKAKKNLKFNKNIGCSIAKLMYYIESKFKPGMSWGNYGRWHIDHIKPCSSFDLSKPSEQLKCFNYKNLQPLWAHENLSKGDKY